jgi:hypothetical protein
MATAATPKGLTPVGYLSGRPYNGAFRQIKIASGLASNIFNGDCVKMLSSGTIDKDSITTAVTANAALGVFLGCSYTDPNLNYKVFRNYWPTGTVASDAYAFVADDPGLIFQIQASAAVTQTNLGNNACLINTAGSTLVGRSRIALDATTNVPATTNTFPFKIIGFVEGGGNTVGDAFTEVLVKWNFGMHHYDSATGI